MAVKRNGLGKGLDSLIPNKTSKPAAPADKEGYKTGKRGQRVLEQVKFW